MTIAALRAKRAEALDAIKAERVKSYASLKTLAEKKDFKSDDQTEFDRLQKAVEDLDAKLKITSEEYDAEIKRAQAIQDLGRENAVEVEGQHKPYAQAKFDVYTNKAHAEAKGLVDNRGLIVGGVAKLIGAGGGSYFEARNIAKEVYGENHPVTKALMAGVGAAGGFLVPPDYVNEIIELLRPAAVVRSAGPRGMPMPRGTMTLPSQTSAATATYGSETAQNNASQPQVGDIVATYKKLMAFVPVTNDLMRYADPAADAFVRDDLVKVMALREDLAFMTGDGTADAPKGFLGFANMWAAQNGGTVGSFLTSANSTAASGGNWITSSESYTLATVAQEIGGLVNKLDTANVPDMRRMWFMHPRSWNYLNNVQNSLGIYVYRDELSTGKLLGYPFKKSTQMPINIYDNGTGNHDCSFVMLVEMTDALLLDSMQLELSVSREGTYYDASGTLQSAFQRDQTLIRAIAEHDFQMRHPASIAIDQFVRWAPAIS